MTTQPASYPMASGTPDRGPRSTAQPVTTPPSRVARRVLRPMTRVFNPIIRRVAGRRHPTAVAQVRHRGRRSGRQYVTPVSARVVGGRCYIPLTFGDGSDWCQNVRAAGECRIRWKGHEYRGVEPHVVDTAIALVDARSAFRPPERFFLRVIGIKKFLLLELTPETASRR